MQGETEMLGLHYQDGFQDGHHAIVHISFCPQIGLSLAFTQPVKWCVSSRCHPRSTQTTQCGGVQNNMPRENTELCTKSHHYL